MGVVSGLLMPRGRRRVRLERQMDEFRLASAAILAQINALCHGG
jgi:hypothetical protein